MENKKFSTEICEFLNIPSIPNKEWDGKSSFESGVAIVKTVCDTEECAVCTFNNKVDKVAKIIKVWGSDPFLKILNVYPVPLYMEDDITKMDFHDESSKEAMEALLEEKKQLINEGIDKPKDDTSEWGYSFIHDKKEAVAFLKTKKIKGAIPTKEEVLKMKLKALYRSEQKNKNINK